MDSRLSRDVGKRIKTARLKSGLTQEQVAKKADLNTNYFAVIERGETNTTLEKLQKISKALGIDISYLTNTK